MKYTALLLTLALFTACSSPDKPADAEATTEIDANLPLDQKVNLMIEADQYEEALALLDAEETSEEILGLKEKTHLNYGLFIIYNSDPSKMRENANNGLRQFINVLDINRGNDKAVSEIEQIMGIYATFPDRGPDEDVMEDLRRLGFNY